MTSESNVASSLKNALAASCPSPNSSPFSLPGPVPDPVAEFAWQGRDPQPLSREGGEVPQLTVVHATPYMTGRARDPSVLSVLSPRLHAAGPLGRIAIRTNTRRRGGHGGCHDGTQLDPSRAIHNHAFGLQNGCRTRSEQRVWREKSLQMIGSAYGIRTRVTAVRGRPEGLSDRDQRSASGHGKSQELWPFAAKIRAQFPNASQRRQSRTEDLGCISVRLGPLGFPTWSGNLRRGGGVTHWVAVARRG